MTICDCARACVCVHRYVSGCKGTLLFLLNTHDYLNCSVSIFCHVSPRSAWPLGELPSVLLLGETTQHLSHSRVVSAVQGSPVSMSHTHTHQADEEPGRAGTRTLSRTWKGLSQGLVHSRLRGDAPSPPSMSPKASLALALGFFGRGRGWGLSSSRQPRPTSAPPSVAELKLPSFLERGLVVVGPPCAWLRDAVGFPCFEFGAGPGGARNSVRNGVRTACWPDVPSAGSAP